jgi:hypothetical protein
MGVGKYGEDRKSWERRVIGRYLHERFQMDFRTLEL